MPMGKNDDPIAQAVAKNLAWSNDNWQEEDAAELEKYKRAKPSRYVPAPEHPNRDVEGMDADEEEAVDDGGVGPSPFGRKALANELKRGTVVDHPRFGKGVVVNVDARSYSIPMVTVRFDAGEITRSADELTVVRP